MEEHSTPSTIKHLILLCLFIALGGTLYVTIFELKVFDKSSQELIFSHDMPESSVHHQSALFFKKLVEQKSKGSLKIKIYPNQSLGSDKQSLDLVRRGEAAITVPPTAKMTEIFPEYKFLDLPFLFSSKSKFFHYLENRFLDSSLLKALNKKGLEPIGFWDSGAQVITSERHLAHPDQYIGKRFRVMKSATLTEVVHQLGALPTHIDFLKIKQAIGDGVIDIQTNPIVSVVARRIHEVHKHIHKTNHAFLAQQLVFSTKIKNSLSERNWEIIRLAAQEAANFQKKLLNSLEATLFKTAEEGGAIIHDIDEKTQKIYIQKFSGMYKSRSKSILQISEYINPGILDAINSTITIPINLSMAPEARKSASALIKGVALAINELNSSGGALNKSFVTQIFNHGGFPNNGLKNLKTIIKQNDIPAVIGGMHSPVILGEQDYVNKNNLNYLVPWAAASPIIPLKPEKKHSIFRFSVRDSWVAPFILERAKGKSIGIGLVLEHTAWGKSNQTSLVKNLEKSGFKDPYTGWFKWGEKNFSAILSELANRSIDKVVFVGNAPEGVEFLKDLANSNLKISVYSHWGILGGDFFQQAKQYLPQLDLQVIHTFAYEPDSSHPKVKAFWQAYNRHFNIEEPSDVHAPFATVHAYELTKLLAKAIIKAGSTDREKVHAALKMVSLEGIHKNYEKPFWGAQEALTPDDLNMGRIDSSGLIRDLPKEAGE